MDTQADELDREAEIRKEMNKILSAKVGRWKVIDYDSYASWSYLIGGMAAYDYACLLKIMKEIKQRNPKFNPKTLLDFGSGVGTVSWYVLSSNLT